MSGKLIWSTEPYEQEDIIEILEDALRGLGEHLRDYVLSNIGADDYLYIETNKADWTGRRGYRKVALWDKDDLELGKAVLPEYDCVFNLYQSLEDKSVYAEVSSHDIPTGATWRMYPMKDVEEVMEYIIAECDGESFDILAESIYRDLDLDIKDWQEEDITSDYNETEEYNRVIMYGNSLTVFYLNGNIVEIECDEEDIEAEYVKVL